MSQLAEIDQSTVHHEQSGINPAVAVVGAIVVSGLLLVAGYYTFNRSSAATAAREISKQHQAARKAQANDPDAQAIDDGSKVTTESIDKQTEKIDQTLRSNDLGSGQVQADDLSDKGLGLQ